MSAKDREKFTIHRLWKLSISDWILLAGSVALQGILALLLGHLYDQRIFMATGYLAANGLDPYVPLDLRSVFHNLYFENFTSIGYPPPWPLVTGLIYRITYAVSPNFLLYNFALKVPILAANIGLAFLTARVVERLTADSQKARRAWRIMLFNPLLLYATAAWGQNDSVVALLALSAILLLDSRAKWVSAVLLALAISVKPTALPLVLIPFFTLYKHSIRQTIAYYGTLLGSGILFCIVPFWLLGWDATPILQNWNAHFTVGGGMSFLVFLEALQGTYQLDGWWWSLGLLWLPGLMVAAFFLRHGIHSLPEILRQSAAVILIFFLTRAWVSEQNIVLLLPFVVILTLVSGLDNRALTALWVLPLVFSLFNTAPAQLLFPAFPGEMEKFLSLYSNFRAVWLLAKILVVIPWTIFGWRLVIWCFRSRNVKSGGLQPELVAG